MTSDEYLREDMEQETEERYLAQQERRKRTQLAALTGLAIVLFVLTVILFAVFGPPTPG